MEQLPEIALVDITGLAKAEVLVQPDMASLQHTGLSLDALTSLIKNQSGELGNVIIRYGPYEYGISFEASLRSIKDIENLYFKVGKDNPRLIRLGNVSKISVREQKSLGLYTFNGKRAIAMAVVKQSDTQLMLLRDKMNDLVGAFKRDYPKVDFQISQDQTELLDLSISNLVNSLITGAILSFLMILFFMKDKRVLLFIALVIPVSLTITLLAFYIFGISINIVSLAGLVLGIGEIIDSAIIIIENIEQYLERNWESEEVSIADACINGTADVIKPLFTSVLTNSVVFLPLLFLSGIAGALFFDQAIAVSLALGISLLTSYTLVPVLYFQFFKNKKYLKKPATQVSLMAEKLYNKVFYFAMKRPGLMTSIWAILILTSFWIAKNIDKKGMPDISRNELEAYINWNESVSPHESDRRLLELMQQVKTRPSQTGIFVGQQQFVLNNRLQQSSSEGLIVARLSSSKDFDSLRAEINYKLKQHYPFAIFEVRPSLNVFEQLFQTSESKLRVLLSSRQNQEPLSLSLLDSASNLLRKNGISVQTPTRRQRVQLHVREDRLLFYGVEINQVVQVLRVRLSDANIGILRSQQEQIPILLGSQTNPSNLQNILNEAFVSNQEGSLIPVSYLVIYSNSTDYASLYLGRDGPYVPLEPREESDDIPAQKEKIAKLLSINSSIAVRMAGSYYRNISYIEELANIIIIAIGLLFFILAAQFESLQQPFIVLLTIVFGITGGLLCLYFAGNSLNIMSAVGMIVLIGLIDNDSILKIDTMNRFRGEISLLEAIRLGGQKRLQSQLMTFLTTELALLPILWSSGLGAELQTPLALAVIGGMRMGVLISWTFIPLTYYWLYKKRAKI